MHLQASFAGHRCHLRHLRRIDGLPASGVVGVLYAQQLGVRLVIVVRLYRGNDVIGLQPPIRIRRQRLQEDRTQYARAASLVCEDMRPISYQCLVPSIGVR